jgi:hypothetical protein
MAMPGFTAERAVSSTSGRWRGRPDPMRQTHEGEVIPQQGDWSYHCEQFGFEIICCDCWDGQCFCRKPGPIYEF